MGLEIKNPALQASVRALVELTGESPAEAVAKAVGERLERLERPRAPKRSNEEMLQTLRDIQGRMRDFPEEYRTSNHDDLYDEHGLPR